MTNNVEQPSGDDGSKTRDNLARIVVPLSIWAVIGFAFLALAVPFAFSVLGMLTPQAPMSSADKAASAAMVVLNVVAPIFAGWVGAVIGYYFANKSHRDAASNVERFLKYLSPSEKLRSAPMKLAMKLPASMSMVTVSRDGGGRIINPISEALAVVKGQYRTRAPLVETVKRGGVEFQRMVQVLHESTLYDFLHRKAAEGKKLDELTIQDLLDDPVSAERLSGTLKALCDNDPLLEAKKLMERNPRVQDVVITTTGQLDAPMVGWVTNVDVLRHIIQTTSED